MQDNVPEALIDRDMDVEPPLPPAVIDDPVQLDPIDIDNHINNEPIDVDLEVEAVMKTTRYCAGIMPLNRAAMNANLDIVHKYGRNGVSAPYVLKYVGDTEQANLYSKLCTRNGIARPNRRNPGVRCDSCHSLWTERSFKLKKYVTGWAD